ncbi:ABC transporter permease [Calothrix sp. 336/3]|uniref:ABC transporter permease n=1 Tax=Calothrix sp. 336/3 TaxID=1337936 RepID=UPI0004E3F261|nr:ABC transporter permease [Calothrix sp. 336/3]AKG24239.1 sugar ABC transporter permease [Calothrix sp. 336/3]
MVIKIAPRNLPSLPWQILSPLLALLATIITGFLLFIYLGQPPVMALTTLFITPISSLYGITEIAIKAAPILLISVGLSVCFTAQIWNIGAEGQFTIGAIFASGIALIFSQWNNYFLLLFCLLSGILGGMVWATIPALCKIKANANEILTSLMLNYVAISLLNYLVREPLKDPNAFNFPESATFSPFATLQPLIIGTRLHLGVIFAAIAAIMVWFLLKYSFFGFTVRVVGASQKAADYAGINRDRVIWLSFLISGGLAGLAGACEVLGLIGQLRPVISPGYGYAAIMAAFIARLHPLGMILSSLLMALLYVGSELLQIKLGFPLALAGVFQGILLFFLLATNLLIDNFVTIGKTSKNNPN